VCIWRMPARLREAERRGCTKCQNPPESTCHLF
jgi:hypothetical protein